MRQRDRCQCGTFKVKEAKRCKACNTELQRKSMPAMFNGNSPMFHAKAEVALCSDGTMAHKWQLETPVPGKPTSFGRCTLCPLEREFDNVMAHDFGDTPASGQSYFNPEYNGDYLGRVLMRG